MKAFKLTQMLPISAGLVKGGLSRGSACGSNPAVGARKSANAEAGQIYEQFLSIDPNNSVLQAKVKELSEKH